MRASELDVYEVPNRQQLPPQLTVGAIYFLMDEGKLIVNHGGGRIVEYGGGNAGGTLPEVGYWAINQGGTGATTQAGARANLQALGMGEAAASAQKWTTPRKLNVTGAVTGSATLDGSGDVTLQTVAPPDPDLSVFEVKANKVNEIRPVAQATATSYPSESAVRNELDKYALKADVVQNYKGVFPTGAALKAAIPQSKPGDYALVTETNTTWAWNNNPGSGPLGWYDTGEIEAEGIKSVNGKMGASITLDIAEDLGGMTKTEIETRVTQVYDSKEDKLADTVRAGLSAAANPSATNPFATVEQTRIDPSITALPAVVMTHTDEIATLKQGQGTARIIATSILLSRDIDGITLVPIASVPPQTLPYGVGRTLVKDSGGSLGVIDGVDTENLTVVTLTTSSTDTHAVWLGFVENFGDLPANKEECLAVFQREASISDYARVRVDETQRGATVEYRVTDISSAGAYNWGNPFVLNTTEYQEQTTAQHSGMIPIAGDRPGTWGGWINPTNFWYRAQFDIYLGKGTMADPPHEHILSSRMRDACAWAGRTGEKLVIVGVASSWYGDAPAPNTPPRIRLRYLDVFHALWVQHPEDLAISTEWGMLERTTFTNPITLNGQSLLDIDLLTPSEIDCIRLHVYGYVVPVQ